jgi:hypothetical protein
MPNRWWWILEGATLGAAAVAAYALVRYLLGT